MSKHDWAGALTLRERRDLHRAQHAPDPPPPQDPDSLLRQHERWASRPIHKTVDDLVQRLAVDGISLAEYAAVSRGDELPQAALCRSWVVQLDEITQDWSTLGAEALSPEPQDPVRSALQSVVRPFSARLLRELHTDLDKLRTGDAHGVLTDDALAANLMNGFLQRARQYAYPVVALELHTIRDEFGLGEAELPRAAETFLERVGRPDGSAVLARYPVLARTLVELSIQHRRNVTELARRVRDDAALLAERFASPAPLGHLVELSEPWGDAHRDGRAVLALRFSEGLRVLYKPRPLAIDVFVADFLRWLNATGIEATQRPVEAVDRGRYGWTEVIEPAPCASVEEVQRYYRRQGGLVAACHVLAGKDLHCENIIAEGQFPVAVDLEAFFQPRLPRQHGEQPYTSGSLAVLESRLLPQGFDEVEGRRSRFDRSGIAAKGGAMPVTVTRLSPPEEGLRFTQVQAHAEPQPNLPVLDGERVAAARYACEVEAGFREVAAAIHARASELTGPDGLLAQAAGRPIRVFLRPTSAYSRVAAVTYHPEVMRDALDRERALDLLWPPDDAPPVYRAAFPCERDALLAGDVPLFVMIPESKEILDSDGNSIGIVASCTGMEVAEQRLRSLEPGHVDDLAWVVRASITQTAEPSELRQLDTLVPRAKAWEAVTPDSLRRRAAELASLIARRAERGPDGLTWAGFTGTDDGWVFGPLRADLFHGTAGIVLFLAYAGSSTGEQGFTRLAREGLDTIRATWARRLDAAPTWANGASPGGAFEELGGAILALTHLSVLWDSEPLAREALDLCRLADTMLEKVEECDIIGGVAGTLALALTLHKVVPDASLLRLATRCGQLLAARAERQAQGVAWPSGPGRYLGGFAHGAAGIAAALTRLARATGDRRWSDLASAARTFEDSLFSAEHGNWVDVRSLGPDGDGTPFYPVSWCVGSVGVALGRAIMYDGRDDAVTDDLRTALRTTANTLEHRSHSLCHGSFGKLLVLRRCQQFGEEILEGGEVQELVAATLDTLDTHGLVCPMPDGLFTPGFMLGAAGVAYALLALADPALPSVIGLDDLPS